MGFKADANELFNALREREARLERTLEARNGTRRPVKGWVNVYDGSAARTACVEITW